MHGEVEFQYLLVAFVIRVAAPEAWDFTIKRFDIIRAIADTSREAFSDETKKKQAIKERRVREQALFRQLSRTASWDRDAISALIEFLFRGWLDIPVIDPIPTVQSPSDNSTTDYWRRILSEAIDEIPSDQEFLRSLNNWKAKLNASSFVSLVLDVPRAARMLEQFGGQLDDEQIIRLAEDLLSESITRLGARQF